MNGGSSKTPKAGDVVGPVRLLEQIGEGGFGSVWKVEHLRTGEILALKILHPKLYTQNVAAGPSIADRFLREARLLQELRHPGVVRILDVIEEPAKGIIAYLMELLVGKDLGQVAASASLETILEMFARVAETLSHLHARSLLHRDIKLSNIFVCNPEASGGERAVKLIDFGVAKDLEASSLAQHTATGYFVGTLESMAPETFFRLQGEDIQLTGAVDQWSLGVAMFHALSGAVPFRATNASPMPLVQLQKSICREPAPALKLLPHHGSTEPPAALEAIIRRCLEKDPTARHPSLGEVALALRAFINSHPTQPTPIAFNTDERTNPILQPAHPTVPDGDRSGLEEHTERGMLSDFSEGDESEHTEIESRRRTTEETPLPLDGDEGLETVRMPGLPPLVSTPVAFSSKPSESEEHELDLESEDHLAPTLIRTRRDQDSRGSVAAHSVPVALAGPSESGAIMVEPVYDPSSDDLDEIPSDRRTGLSPWAALAILATAAVVSFLLGLYVF